MPGSELVVAGAGAVTVSLAQAERAASDFIAASKAAATRRAYAADWRDFESWCREHQLTPLPAEAETVALYLSALAVKGRRVTTIRRRCAAIGHVHRLAGHERPTDHAGVKATLDGIARELGSAPDKKAALTVELLAKALRKLPDTLTGRRDRALILIGFAAALRRSELVAIDRRDIRRHPKGIVITIRRSKTDQQGRGHEKAIPHGRKLHALAALDAWLDAAAITEGAVFRGVRGSTVLPGRLCTKQVARIVQARVAAIGLDAGAFGAHSMRSGFITSASDSDASIQRTAKHVGHAKLDTTLGYVQVADAFRDHPGRGFL